MARLYELFKALESRNDAVMIECMADPEIWCGTIHYTEDCYGDDIGRLLYLYEDAGEIGDVHWNNVIELNTHTGWAIYSGTDDEDLSVCTTTTDQREYIRKCCYKDSRRWSE